MSQITGESVVWLFVVIFLIWGAFRLGHAKAHEELLAQCKGPELGIRLHVGQKSYFYYCSYVKP